MERLRARLDVSSAAAWMDEVCARGGATPERFSDSAWLFASLGAEPHLVPIGAGIAAALLLLIGGGWAAFGGGHETPAAASEPAEETSRS